MKTALLTALAIATTTSFALAAEPVKLTADQLDNITAGKNYTTTTYLGNSSNLQTTQPTTPGRTTTITNGNTTNTNCNGCGTTGPGQ